MSVALCECGCGQPTNLRKGKYCRFIKGHNARFTGPRYIVDENGCWIWQLQKSTGGYGCGKDADGRAYYAHRVMWEAENGPIPEGLEIDHLCRVRACVNPAHLEPVTRAENVQRGLLAKLTEDDVRAIRASTETHRVLAARYGVAIQTIGNVKYHTTWRDLEKKAAA